MYNTEEIELSDGSTVKLKPLTLKRLREFMPKMQEWQDHLKAMEENNSSNELQSMAILTEAAAICLVDQKPDWKEKPELAEEVLDMETTFRVIEICGGMKLNDENLIQAAREAQMRALGTN